MYLAETFPTAPEELVAYVLRPHIERLRTMRFEWGTGQRVALIKALSKYVVSAVNRRLRSRGRSLLITSIVPLPDDGAIRVVYENQGIYAELEVKLYPPRLRTKEEEPADAAPQEA